MDSPASSFTCSEAKALPRSLTVNVVALAAIGSMVVRWPRGLVVLVAYSQRRYRYNGSRHRSQAQRGSHANEKFGVITHVT
eukprot:scaffold19927_cov65-Phaeocystis_antarctica.AAC.9